MNKDYCSMTQIYYSPELNEILLKIPINKLFSLSVLQNAYGRFYTTGCLPSDYLRVDWELVGEL